MVLTKIIKVYCFDSRCKKFGAEYLYFKFYHKIANREYSFVTFYCTFHQFLDIDKTWWNFSMINRMCELFESGKNNKEVTETLNKDFNLNLEGKSTKKGYKGGIVKKWERLKENSIDWESYTDDTLLKKDTRIVFTKNKNINRYGLLRDKHNGK